MNVPNWAPFINIVTGILTIISPFVFASTSYGARWDMVVTGVIIGIVAIISMSVYAHDSKMHYWPVINVLAGIWLFISIAFVQGDVGMIWSNVVLGVLSIVTAAVALSYESVHAHVRRPSS